MMETLVRKLQYRWAVVCPLLEGWDPKGAEGMTAEGPLSHVYLNVQVSSLDSRKEIVAQSMITPCFQQTLKSCLAPRPALYDQDSPYSPKVVEANE